jgi:excisionase family DNA binding protein
MQNVQIPISRKWLTIQAACDRWSIGRTKLYELIRANRLTAVKLGARTLVSAEGDAFFASLPRLHGGED